MFLDKKQDMNLLAGNKEVQLAEKKKVANKTNK
jgi:hypothetical protein